MDSKSAIVLLKDSVTSWWVRSPHHAKIEVIGRHSREIANSGRYYNRAGDGTEQLLSIGRQPHNPASHVAVLHHNCERLFLAILSLAQLPDSRHIFRITGQ